MDKSPDAFRTISEVAEELDLPQHVLRFWETRFAQIRPLKRGGGRRYYRPDDVDLLKGIRHFLYGEGYTIRGVQRILKAEGVRFVQAVGRGERSADSVPDALPPDLDRDEPGPADEPADDAVPESSGPALAARDLHRLRSALAELRECNRVLSALKAAAEAGGEMVNGD
jgi:DNA-binding transcriptional MerR regulator